MAEDVSTTAYIANIEEAGFRRMMARLALLHAVLRHQATQQLSDRQALEDVAALFNRREAPVAAWVYDCYDSVSGRTLRRWKERLDAGGLIGLSDDYGKRSERTYTSYFDPGSPHRKIALHHLADHPGCTASDVLEEMRRQLPESELPDLRTVQRFMEKFKM